VTIDTFLVEAAGPVSDLAFDDPCVMFALRREAAPFLREFRPQQAFPGCPCRARFCGPSWLTVLVLETGVGAAAAEAAAEWLLKRPKLGDVPYRPKVVIAAGFAAGLQPASRVGDVVLATEVLDADGTVWPATWPGELPPGEWRPPLHRGRVVTAAGLLTTAAEKAALGSRYGALAADLESAVLARACRRHGIPFGCVRAVSDDAATALSPLLAGVLAGGRVSVPRLVTTVARSPGLTTELWRLAGATRRAAAQLGLALGELLTLTLPWGNDL
jgi:adenosylhomocysteine nucleosidase